MDQYRSSQQDQDSLASIPVSLGSYHNPPPPNPIRVSAFSKPCSSASSSLNILTPKDHHHHHHHHGTVIARNNGSSTASEFMTPTTAAAAYHHPLQDPVPVSISAATPDSKFKYQECLRNHAASVGGHVLDGCCEFMPSNADPVKCAACDCHRSFHRKQTEGNTSRRDRISLPLLLPPPPPTAQLYQKQQQFAFSAAFPPSPSGVVLPFGGNTSGSGATTESSSEERLDAGVRVAPHHQHNHNMVVSKKRFRTKFRPEQKEKMLSFAERVGWRIQRQDDSTIEELCRELGIRRQVLKVWMHNNKHSIIRKQEQQEAQLQQIHQPPQAADSAPLMTPTSPPSIFGHVRS